GPPAQGGGRGHRPAGRDADASEMHAPRPDGVRRLADPVRRATYRGLSGDRSRLDEKGLPNPGSDVVAGLTGLAGPVLSGTAVLVSTAADCCPCCHRPGSP